MYYIYILRAQFLCFFVHSLTYINKDNIMICIKSSYIMYICIIYITRAILCVMTYKQSA